MEDTGKPWFRPKSFGYGAGLPLCWQGWALIAMPLVGGPLLGWLFAHLFGPWFRAPATAISVGILLIPTVIIARAKTEGGWRWRNGED